MKRNMFVYPFFIAVAVVLIAACGAYTSDEIPSTSTPAPTKIAPILSTGLDRDCEFREPTAEKLEVGDLAVEFSLRDVHGNEYTLSELLSEKPVVMIFGSYT